MSEQNSAAVATAEDGGLMTSPENSVHTSKENSSATPVRVKSPLHSQRKRAGLVIRRYKKTYKVKLDSGSDDQSEDLELLSENILPWVSDHGTMTSDEDAAHNKERSKRMKKRRSKVHREALDGINERSGSLREQGGQREQRDNEDLSVEVRESDPEDDLQGGLEPQLQSFISKCISTRKKGVTCWITCSVILFILLVLMIAVLALMAYCLSEVILTNKGYRSHIPMSTSEVYSVNAIQPNHSMYLYTGKVCIKQVNESLENVKVTLEHGSCSHVSITTKLRTIKHSFSSIEEAERLNFYWIKNTSFSFNLTIFSYQEPDNLTIYVFEHNYDDASDDCTDGFPPDLIYSKLDFSYPGNKNNSRVTCTHDDFENTSTCFSLDIVVNITGRYHMCIIDKHPSFVNVSYRLNINEVRYTNTSKFDSTDCHLEEKSCCSSFDNIIKEANNPTCMLIETTHPGDDDNAYFLPQSFHITTQSKWDGVTYSFCLFIMLTVVVVVAVTLCCYTCYKRRHPQGYCLKLSVNDVTCFC